MNIRRKGAAPWRANAAAGAGVAALLCALVVGCGGGSGGNQATGQTPPSGGSPPPRPPPSRPPFVAHENALLQRAVHLHPYRYDAAQGGTTFGDPDGDPLTYEVLIGHTYNPYSDPNPPLGLHVEGTYVVGAPEELAPAVVTIIATDPSGQTANNQFFIRVDPNSDPVVVSPNADHFVSVGAVIGLEASQAGAALSDPDGDALTYEVALRGQPRGLAIAGTVVSGVFNSVGLVEVTVTARDVYGGSGADVFTIGAPAPEPGPPNLPTTSYRYEDAALELPFVFADSGIDTTPDDNRTTDVGATLGRVLFYDKRLSGTNTVACGSCHRQDHGFASPERFNSGALGLPLRRHTMALANARYTLQHSWFSDMRVSSLQELVLMPIENPEELGSPLSLVESKLASTGFYPPLFQAAFGTPEITRDRISRALAQFVQALMSYRAKFDLAYNPMCNCQGDPTPVLTAQELRGADIFRNGGPETGKCEVCHETRLLTNSWHANNGLDVVPTDPGTQNPALQRDGSLGVFKAASLRNIAVTAPYMHDGRFATLRDVINHYDHGVQDSRHLDGTLRDFSGTGAPRRLNLSEEDKDALEAFLNTMTDPEFLNDPKFSDPFQTP